ncbi:MAG: methyltransferase [Paramuribaculum sp.]|nr:methyltransferase [Paramuribaculum sp.]
MSRFDFKQFSVYQDACAMKVGTDGVLLGAWADLSDAERIWDVGTGTGLIALMLAQRSASAQIAAVEIESAACAQARGNVAVSPWSDRIDVVEGDIRSLADTLSHPDLIVSNPPFFTNALRPVDNARSTARHDSTLPVRDLMQIASQVLTPNGSIAIIIPADRSQDAVVEATLAGLSPWRITAVRTTPAKAPKRMLMQFGRRGRDILREDHHIQKAPGCYSEWYSRLTHDFYLR